MAYVSLSSKLNTQKYKNVTVQYVADVDQQYLLWLHNSRCNVYLGKSVFEYMGLWDQYKDTEYCRRIHCLQK